MTDGLPTVADAKKIAKRDGLIGVIILGFYTDEMGMNYSGVSYGGNERLSRMFGDLLKQIGTALDEEIIEPDTEMLR